MPSVSKTQKAIDRKMYDAVKIGNHDLVKTYLQQGANPNATVGKKGMTAMHRVSMSGNRKLELTLEDFGGTKIRLKKSGNFSPDIDSEDEDIQLRVGDEVSLSPTAVDELDAMYGPLNGPDDVGTVMAINTKEKRSILVKTKAGEEYRYTPQALMTAVKMKRARSMKHISPSKAEIAAEQDKAAKVINQLRNVRDMAAQMETLSEEIFQQKKVQTVKTGGMSRLAFGTQKSLRSRMRTLSTAQKTKSTDDGQKRSEKLKAELEELGALGRMRSPTQIEGSGADSPPLQEEEETPPPVDREQKKSMQEIPVYKPPEEAIPVYKPATAEDVQVYEVPVVKKKEKKKNKNFQFNRKNLKIGQKLGEGNFGIVFAGEAKGLVKGEKVTKVAIKQLSDHSDEGGMKDEFMTEADIMQDLDGSDKVCRLLGICSEEEPYCMLMELMSRGDLKQVLRQERPKKKKASIFSWKQLYGMACDISEGMAYLAGKKIVHRDLAARNCLVNDVYTVKIGDFGLTRNVYSQEYYRCTGSAPLPIRWMSPESLTDGVSTGMSDVWSFGVVVWEIATFAKLPYGLLSNMEVCEMVCEDDYRMPIPKGCPAELYKIMTDCWQEAEDDRPMFSELQKRIGKMIKTAPKDPVAYVKKADTEVATPVPPQLPQEASQAYIDMQELDSDNENDSAPAHYIGVVDSQNESTTTPSPEKPASEPKPTPATVSMPKDKPNSLFGAGRPSMSTPSGGTGAQASAVAALAVQRKPITKVASSRGTNKGSDMKAMIEEVCEWIEEITGEAIPQDDVQATLKSGTVLCKLANSIKPGTTRKPHTKKLAAMHRENVGWFLASLDGFGVPSSDQFVTNDLYENSNMRQVMYCLLALKRIITQS